MGRCPDCQAWNSFIETAPPSRSAAQSQLAADSPQELSQARKCEYPRFSLSFAEMNRVLGGGLVPGSLVLVGGEPGIGKSTLLLQVSAMMAETGKSVAYVSGEESISQVKLRSERLGVDGRGIYFLSQPNLAAVLECLDRLAPGLVIIDSIQTMYLEDVAGMPGSISQVRECTWRLQRWAKQGSVPLFIAGHVTKEGAIAGPGTLEHIVDVVLYFEGEPFSSYRVLRSAKNRFGSTNEVGIFEMSERGLIEVENPSQVFLSAHTDAAVGSVVVPALEGNRPLLVEIQALPTPNSFGPPRRIANGIDFNRLLLIVAVLTKRAGLRLFNQDIIVNVTGGLRVSEPAVDLGIALAIASGFRDARPLSGLVAVGEVGLSGELRGVSHAERRIAEAVRLGFRSCLVPVLSPALLREVRRSIGSSDMRLIQVGSVAEALTAGLTGARRRETAAVKGADGE
jgi:DNA repair protein RadA/Sms